MRRIALGTLSYLADLSQWLRRGWDSFFFTPADPTALGLIRVVTGLLALWSLLVLGLDLHAFLGSEGWADLATLQRLDDAQGGWSWSFWTWLPDAAIRPVWVGCLAILAAYTLGLGSKITAPLAWAILVSTSRRMPIAVFGFDQILATWVFYLAVTGASGQAVSLDRFLARWRAARAELARRRRSGQPLAGFIAPGAPTPTVSASIALRLIQLHLCLIYGMAGLAKLQGPAWWSGEATALILGYSEFRTVDLTWLAGFPWLLMALTHASLALEVLYPVLIWVARLRPLVLLGVALLHIGIALTMGLHEFAAAMIAGNLAFVSGTWLRSLVTGLAQPAATVLYDGACPRCRASVAILGAADPDHILELADLTAVNLGQVDPRLSRDACMAQMHVVRRDGRIDAGFDAVRTCLRWLPLTSPLGLLLSIPGVGPIGRQVYNRIAANRPREACTDETCDLPANRPHGGPARDRTRAGEETAR